MNDIGREVAFDLHTSASPDRVRAALLDFSDSRPRSWPGMDPAVYQVYSQAETTADVREGSKAPGGDVWAREHYDWSDPDTVRWTVVESNFSVPGSYVSATISPGEGGGSLVHVTWNRAGSTPKGRMVCRMIRLTGGKPVADSFRKGLALLEPAQASAA